MNLPLPVPVKLPPILIFPPFVLNVIAEVNVWLLDKVIAPVVAEPNVTPVNPGWRYVSSVDVKSRVPSTLFAPPNNMATPLVEGLMRSDDWP